MVDLNRKWLSEKSMKCLLPGQKITIDFSKGSNFRQSDHC